MAQDLPRHLGQHSGGMVICQGQLDSVVPLEPATMPGRVVVQWDKEDCADLGIIKVDLLGLGMMAVIEDTLKLIPEIYGEPVDLAHLPQDDPAVFAALQKADTIGMFQVESRAQMSSLPRMRPNRFYDIVVQVAIIRPGPIVGKMVHPYLNRRQGREAPDCLHPSLEPVLRRTLGVPLFQEQLLRMAMIAAGFTGGQAEELRRAMGFKRSEKRMAEIEVKLRAGMDAQRHHRQGAGRYRALHHLLRALRISRIARRQLRAAGLCQRVSEMPLPGRLHLRHAEQPAHGLLFARHPDQGRAAPRPARAAGGCGGIGLGVHGYWGRGPGAGGRGPAHVCATLLCCRPRGSGGYPQTPATPPWPLAPGPRPQFAPRPALRQRAARGGRPRHRARRGRFSSVDDLALRVPELRKDELNRLAEIGALNSLDRLHRRDALWQAQRAILPVGPLLEMLEEKGQPSPLAPMNTEERLWADYRGTGLTVGRHPMAYRRAEMNALGVMRAGDLARIPDGRVVRIAGSVIVRQRPGTANGFVFLSMEDETGIMNAILTPQVFDRYKFAVLGEPFLLIDGVLQNLDGVISVKAGRIAGLHGPAAESHDFH